MHVFQSAGNNASHVAGINLTSKIKQFYLHFGATYEKIFVSPTADLRHKLWGKALCNRIGTFLQFTVLIRTHPQWVG